VDRLAAVQLQLAMPLAAPLPAAVRRRATAPYRLSVECFPALLRLEVSIAQRCPQIAMIEYIADQVQRHARLCKPGTDRAPDIVNPNVLQARARQNAP
jgi:hypothetical protein